MTPKKQTKKTVSRSTESGDSGDTKDSITTETVVLEDQSMELAAFQMEVRERDLESARVRKKGMTEDALDIITTKTKMAAKKRVVDARKVRVAADKALTAAKKKTEAKASMLADMAVKKHPTLKKLADALSSLSGERLRAEHIVSSITVRRPEKESGTWTAIVQTELKYKIALVAVEGGTQTVVKNAPIVIENMGKDHKGFEALGERECKAQITFNKADAEFKVAEEMLLNHPDQADYARVALKEHNLSEMGEDGEALLKRVQALTDGSGDKGYLALL